MWTGFITGLDVDRVWMWTRCEYGASVAVDQVWTGFRCDQVWLYLVLWWCHSWFWILELCFLDQVSVRIS